MDLPNEPKNHHYLPVFYLSGWARSDGRVCRYYRPRDVVVCSWSMPSRTAAEEFLYTLHGFPAEDRQQIEKSLFSEAIDGPAAPIITKLKAEGASRLTNEERVQFARFMMSLQLRDPHSLNEVMQEVAKNIRQNFANDTEYATIRKPDDPETLMEWAQTRAPAQLANAHLLMLPRLIDHEQIGTHLVNMQWAVVDLTWSEHTLLTCDRPIVRTHGLDDHRALWLFPLGPRHLFVAANDRGRLPNLLGASPTRVAREANHQFVGVAVANVYGDTDRHLSFVEARLLRRGNVPRPGVVVPK